MSYLVDSGIVKRTTQEEQVETSPGVFVKNTFHYYSLPSKIDQCISEMLEGSRWECALVHGRSEKHPNNAPFHKKGELNNKKKHLEVLVAKVNELAEEIKALETQVAVSDSQQ